MDAPTEFWGVEVKAGKSFHVVPDDDEHEGLIHISQIALGEVKKGKASEPVVVYVKVDDQKLVLGTLTKDSIPHIRVDLYLEKEAELSHNSKNAAVYFSGYRVVRDYDEDVDDDDLSDSDAELAPLIERAQAAKELAKSGKPAAETDALAKQVKVTDPEEIKVESDDESDSDFSDDDEIDTDSEDSENEEETPAKKGKNSKGNENASKASVPTKKAKVATPEKTDSDADIDSSDDDDISEDEDISDDEDVSEEETPAKKGKNNKRPNEAGSQTPVSAKKAKNATPGKTDVKKEVHIATPYPTKKSGKTPQNAAKKQTPSSSKSQNSKQGHRRGF